MTREGHLAFGGIQNSYSFPRAGAGRVVVGTSAIQLPHIECEQVYFRAGLNNTGIVYLGSADVSTATGMPLAAGEYSPWIPIQDLDILYAVASVASSSLQYFIVR